MDQSRHSIMKRQLDILADNGCWISDDRVYAFVSSAAGVTEIGYHGLQPVSRNSRILVHEGGVLRFFLRASDGVERPLRFETVEWSPSTVRCSVLHDLTPLNLEVRATGRRIVIGCDGFSGVQVSLVIRTAKSSLFTGVYGDRRWDVLEAARGRVLLRCHDRIMLQSWLDRTGPYAGDFLIPEPVRRRIFSKPGRSGSATRADLAEEYREADFPLYDASVFVRIGGMQEMPAHDVNGFAETGDDWVLTTAIASEGRFEPLFSVEFADTADGFSGEGQKTAPGRDRKPDGSDATGAGGREVTTHVVPRLAIDGFPRWSEFISSVPGIVDSCVIRDLGFPRATPGRYYWIWAWDALVSAVEALRWGELDLPRTAAAFVDAHRDQDGSIPARWTRSLEPLDTPSRGSLEFLLASLAYEIGLERGWPERMPDLVPGVIDQIKRAAPVVIERGLLLGEGFYPDLLSAFGRGVGSAVCMDVGSWYCLSRIVEDVARRRGDSEVGALAGECAGSIAQRFLENFWDGAAGFFLDAIEPESGRRAIRHPLFSLLFLQSPFGYALVRPVIDRAGEFVAERFCTAEGIRSLPLEESILGGEELIDSWYPHWDLYALKLLRRAGQSGAIMRWLKVSEKVLQHLGYCPEFLALRGFRESEPDAWLRHGAASNINCVTGWFRAMREGILGIELDPGGMTHVPLSLPLGNVALGGLRWRGGVWEISVNYGGPHIAQMIVDGRPLVGSLKVPIRHSGPGEHRLEVVYGREIPNAHFRELVNGEVHEVRRRAGGVEVELNVTGLLDGTFFARKSPAVTIDGKDLPFRWDEETGMGFFLADVFGEHTIRLT